MRIAFRSGLVRERRLLKQMASGPEQPNRSAKELEVATVVSATKNDLMALKDSRDKNASTAPGTSPDAVEGEGAKPLTPQEQSLVEAMTSIGMKAEAAERFARGVSALVAFIRTLQDMFKNSELTLADSMKSSAKKPAESDGDTPPAAAELPTEEVKVSPEAFDPTDVQNPKKDAEALGDTGEKERQLEQKLQETAAKLDGDTAKEERTTLMNDMKVLTEQLEEAEANVRRKEALEREHARRQEVLRMGWGNAVEKSGLSEARRTVTGVELGGDGDDIVFTVVKDLKEDAIDALKKMGCSTAGGIVTMSMENVDPDIFDEQKEQLQEMLNVAAGIPFIISEVTEPKTEVTPAKEAPVGQIRKDFEGNYWVKQEGGTWGSHNDAERGMRSVSGFRNTQWGDTLMDERTAEIVADDSERSSENIEEQLTAIEKSFSELETIARGYPGNEFQAASGSLLNDLNALVEQANDRSDDLFIGRISGLNAEFSDGSKIRYDVDQQKFVTEQ